MAEPAKVKGTNDFLGTGRRKTAVARVRVRPGTGVIRVNDRELDEYFPGVQEQRTVMSSLVATGQDQKVDVVIRVCGGGQTGQSGACSLGIARALKRMDTQNEEALRTNSLLTRDSRMKERKKYGLRGARRGTQFSKR